MAVDAAAQPAAVLGDVDQLHQLFVNLIDNAIKYGGQGTAVRMRPCRWRRHPPIPARRLAGPRAHLDHDQGPGIATEHLPRLTERFYRVERGARRRPEGTGLGLAIVKHILRRHQGHLAIRSEPGAGSTFSVLLPVGREVPLSPTVMQLA